MAITQIITDFPPAPASSDTPENFNAKADAFVAHQSGIYVPEVNTLASEMNAQSVIISEDATKAATAAAASKASADSAQAAANFKGIWNIAITYPVPSSVEYQGVIYIALVSTTGDQPDISPTQWIESGGGLELDLEMQQTAITATTYLNNNIDAITYATGNKAQYTYDANSNIATTIFTDTDGTTTALTLTYAYDADSNLITITRT